MKIFSIRDYQEINYPILWGEPESPPQALGGRDAHPTRKIVCFFIWKFLKQQ